MWTLISFIKLMTLIINNKDNHVVFFIPPQLLLWVTLYSFKRAFLLSDTPSQTDCEELHFYFLIYICIFPGYKTVFFKVLSILNPPLTETQHLFNITQD